MPCPRGKNRGRHTADRCRPPCGRGVKQPGTFRCPRRSDTRAASDVGAGSEHRIGPTGQLELPAGPWLVKRALALRRAGQTLIRIGTSYFATEVRLPGVSPAGIAFSAASPAR